MLPLWQATPLAPLGGPKPLLHFLLGPHALLDRAAQFVKVGAGHL